MDGDFSNWYFEQKDNFNGVLQQQGKVLLDTDWNAQTRITNNWQDTAGQDIIGGGVAAVPADQPDAFKVLEAGVDSDSKVQLTLASGRIWADGWLVYLDEKTKVSRQATYLKPPSQPPGDGIRDAVILEVWREAINGFQIPDRLIEPALGGPDTTERVYTAIALKLLRLDNQDTCSNISDKLQDNFDNKGKLTVSLQPPISKNGDCPVVAGGGYTGFEHNLYRIEIAQVNSNTPPMFKWSQFNGGLVGRGEFKDNKVRITGNLSAIASSGWSSFYLEAIEYDESLGYWKVTYGATVTLNGNELQLPNAPIFGAIPAAGNYVFFRLWNGIKKISDFLAAPNPNLLGDGIELAFDSADPDKYMPGDYWTFAVRAGEIGNPQILIHKQPPEGIHYHRVPLAILSWNANRKISFADGQIEDCRRIFQPLTRLGNCCTYSVGKQGHGDFDSIQKAVNHLPAAGGQICVLPGVYTENILIKDKQNITIRGCGDRSHITSATPNPVIHIAVSQNIHIESLAITADDTGIGILIDNNLTEPVPIANISAPRQRPSREITLADLHIQAVTRSAIETHVGELITIRDCRIQMKDVTSSWPAIFFVGEDSLIEGNVIHVIPEQQTTSSPSLAAFVAGTPLKATAGLGGLQLGGGSERVRVIDNLIQGGMGHGISLGSVVIRDQTGKDIGVFIAWAIDVGDPCRPKRPGSVYIPPDRGDRTPEFSAGAPLRDIHIEGNRIFDMGLSGISAIHFFNLDAQDEFITVDYLTIVGNEIRQCLHRDLEDIPQNMINSMGYGGIALADGSYLVIWDNVIENNGLNHLEPICGIFILHGEGIEISRNRILNNGAKNNQPANAAKDERRGGINIVFGVVPTVPVDLFRQGLPGQNGMPAIKVHDNIVSVPLGQALSLTALGAVSVVGNQFTSRGVILKTPAPSFIASTVAILNLGLSNELYGQLLAFLAVRNGQLGYMTHVPTVSNNTVMMPQRGLDDLRLGQILANGNVLFSNNQCVLDLLETGLSLSLSSILILSLDDIGFHNNQCDCSLLDDFVLSQAILFGFSVRVSDNRFKEGILNALFSAVTLGIMNMTTDNQSTHCLLIRGWGNMVVNQPNTVLLELFSRDICERYTSILGSFGRG